MALIKRWFMLSLALCAAVTFTALSVQADEAITWSKDFTKTLDQAKKSNKFVLVDFYTSWCSWCRVLDRKTFADPDVAKFINKDFLTVKLDAEDNGAGQKLATDNNVGSFPQGLVFNSSGKLVGRIEGYKDPQEYEAALKKILRR